jgi:hypothetical protein
MNLEEVAQWVNLGKLNHGCIVLKNLEMIFLLFYLSIKGNVHPQDDISFGKVEK